MDSSGFADMLDMLKPWDPKGQLGKVEESYREFYEGIIPKLDRSIEDFRKTGVMGKVARALADKATMLNTKGEPQRAYQVLAEGRPLIEADGPLAREFLYTVIYLQGVASLRIGENENCIDCRGETSCILPISPAAIHIKPEGSRRAIHHFTEYLAKFPDDLEIRWLLNLAHMTLGEHPGKVDPRYLVPLDRFRNSEFDIGKFRDFGHLVGVSRLNQAGGAIMDDFDNDGLLNIFVPRAAWIPHVIRPSLLRNKGDGSFEVVTAGDTPRTIHRHVTSGSSFGANPLEQHVGLGNASKVALVEIHWPATGTTQTFRDLDADQAIEITELADTFRKLPRKPLPQPE